MGEMLQTLPEQVEQRLMTESDLRTERTKTWIMRLDNKDMAACYAQETETLLSL